MRRTLRNPKKTYGVSFDVDLRKQVQEYAEKNDVPFSAAVRQLIRKALAN